MKKFEQSTASMFQASSVHHAFARSDDPNIEFGADEKSLPLWDVTFKFGNNPPISWTVRARDERDAQTRAVADMKSSGADIVKVKRLTS